MGSATGNDAYRNQSSIRVSEPQLPRVWLPGTRGKVVFISAVTGLTLLISGLALDLFLIHQERFRPVTAATVLDTLFALAVAVLVYRLLVRDLEKRARVLERLETIDEMNHHIRNALQVIAFNAHTSSELELREIDNAVDRIQWALSQILPRVEPEFEPFASSAHVPSGAGRNSSSRSQ